MDADEGSTRTGFGALDHMTEILQAENQQKLDKFKSMYLINEGFVYNRNFNNCAALLREN